MRITLDYSHGSGDVGISFITLDPGEESIAMGFGTTCEDAEKNLQWIKDEPEINKKRYRCDKKTPFIAFAKKKGGVITKSSSCINVLADWPTAGPESLTVRSVDF